MEHWSLSFQSGSRGDNRRDSKVVDPKSLCRDSLFLVLCSIWVIVTDNEVLQLGVVMNSETSNTKSVRDIEMKVGATSTATGLTWAYPDGPQTTHYRIPIYKITVSGVKDSGFSSSTDFDVYRFGVKKEGSGQPRSVGLADQQTHVIEMWLPEYTVHSALSAEKGAWKVYDHFLVHDGPDDPNDASSVYATVGCVELCGPAKFDAMNDLIISLSGITAGTRAEKLNAIGTSGKLKITYDAATRPPVIPV